MVYIDVFLELDELTEPITNALPANLQKHYWSNTLGIRLPNGRVFYYVRVAEDGLLNLLRDPHLRDRVVGYSWDGLWNRPYEHRDHVFFASVQRPPESAVIRIPLSDIRSGDHILDDAAWPSGVFSGDVADAKPIPDEFKVNTEREVRDRTTVLDRLHELKEIARTANDISLEERDQLLAYFEAAERLLATIRPDTAAVAVLLERAAKFSKTLASKYIQAKMIDGIEWIVKTLWGLFS